MISSTFVVGSLASELGLTPDQVRDLLAAERLCIDRCGGLYVEEG